jgi:c-di-GMP-binding flagellar brake protein YcgR
LNPQDPTPQPSQRRFERTQDLILVNYRVVDLHADLGAFDEGMTASTVDISAGGMLLRMTEPFAPQTHLDLRFRLKPDGVEIVVLATVVALRPAEYSGVYYVAVQYPLLSDEHRTLIDQHVKEKNQSRG